MLRVVVFAASVAMVLGGRSPNADYIDQLVTGLPGARYSNNVIEDARLDVPGLLSKYGYPNEVHEVVTDDGYVLTMHRIPHGRDLHNQPDPQRPIAFVMHGLVGSSAGFVGMGPGNALAYVLAEEGYDVWLGNGRGNFYSRRHITLNPDRDQAYWRFSWDNSDLSAMFGHIENVTGQKRLHYIGHSQGCTNLLVHLSLNPQDNEKIISFQALAPGAFFTHNQNGFYQILARNIGVVEPAIFAVTRGELLRNHAWVTSFGVRFCHEGSVFNPLCASFIFNSRSIYFNQTMMSVMLGHSPAGSSIRQLAHFSQSINRNTFRRYDYGSITNMELYGSTTPPDYDLSLVTVLTHIHYAVNDAAAHWRDVEILGSRLPNAFLHLVDSPNFDHLDFLTGIRVRWSLYEKVIGLMKTAEVN